MSDIDKQRLRAGNFVSNNGKVLRTINILRHQYNKLSGIQNVLEEDGVSEDEFLDAVNFLALEGYTYTCGRYLPSMKRPWQIRNTRPWRQS